MELSQKKVPGVAPRAGAWIETSSLAISGACCRSSVSLLFSKERVAVSRELTFGRNKVQKSPHAWLLSAFHCWSHALAPFWSASPARCGVADGPSMAAALSTALANSCSVCWAAADTRPVPPGKPDAACCTRAIVGLPVTSATIRGCTPARLKAAVTSLPTPRTAFTPRVAVLSAPVPSTPPARPPATRARACPTGVSPQVVLAAALAASSPPAPDRAPVTSPAGPNGVLPAPSAAEASTRCVGV